MSAIINFTNLVKSKFSDSKDIFEFHGGVHPPQSKAQSTKLPIGKLPLPEKLVLPLRQHIGNIPKIKINIGDYVLKGQIIAEAEGTISAAIHAPTSGTVSAIEDAVIPHPSGLPDQCVIITPDGKDEWTTLSPLDWQSTNRKTLVDSIRLSGIVGLGGATFPTHIKLQSDSRSEIHTLVINAAECEPYITCDDMLMRERSEQIIKGIQITQHLLGVEQVIIGIEDNKPFATTTMQKAAHGTGIQIKVVPTLYPSGDARRLVHLVLGREVPFDKRSTEVGIQVFNVATVLALYRYFVFGEPSISRIVSVTGNVVSPQNFEALFGTPLPHLIKAAGGAKANTINYIMGGPMMGFNLPSLDVPVTKASNCFIAVSPSLFEDPPPAMPCIRCARCADACPVSLQPQELYWFAKSDNFEKSNDYNLFDCIECGACSYVCPSNIPLVQYYRYAKSEIIASDKAQEAADLARERNDFRIARIERGKEERAKKHAERAKGVKAAAAKKAAQATPAKGNASLSTEHTDKKAAIATAIERAKVQKAATAAQSAKPVSHTVKAEIAEIDARRAKAKQIVNAEENAKSTVLVKTVSDASVKAETQATIVRAKAKKSVANTAKKDAN